MRRIYRIGLGAAFMATALAGCGDEDPVSTGSELLTEGLRTVHVILDAPDFLQRDTTYNRIGSLNEASFGIAANDFEGELDANVLFRIRRPFEATYEDSAGNSQRDSLAAIRGATVTVVMDTLSVPGGPVEFEVLDVTESWDPGTATWTERVDTTGDTQAWTTPGGTTGSVRGTATWTSGDTLRIPIDSASASVWHDTVAARKGGLLRVATPGGRLRVQRVDFSFDVVPTGMDTVLQGGTVISRGTVASPDTTPIGTGLRIGGLPVWRSALRFLPLADVPVPCGNETTGCTIPLSEGTVTAANLLLYTQAPGGRRPEIGYRIEGRAILEGPGVPLTRSPMTASLGRMDEDVARSAFAAPAGARVRVPIARYVRENASAEEEETPVLWLALTAVSERGVFGYGQFGSLTSATPPQLELVLTIPVRKVQ